ncbi:MAG: rhomboid family intramembrane serine protease [archaeon]
MIPLGDENPSRAPTFVTWTLILANVLVFLFELSQGFDGYEQMIIAFGLTPHTLLHEGTYVTLLTSMFLHADIFHLGGNMLFLYVFGDNVEDSCGHTGFLIFYLISGVGASILHVVLDPYSTIPTIGASGAISGLLAAYVVLFPRARIRTLLSLGWFIRMVRVPAYIMIGTWFLYQLLYAFLVSDSMVAYWAHIGGFITGLALIRLFARRRPESTHTPYQVTYRY